MLSTDNEINVKKEERKHSWSTVFAWLYLKTIGRISPKRWNRWAENILYYDKTTANNKVQTDAFKTVDESAQVDLKPEVAEKESPSVVISKDGGVQTDVVALCVEKVDKSVEVNLKPEVAEKENKIMSEDEEICSEVSGGPTDENCFDIENELIENNYCEVYGEDYEASKEQLEGISQELELERLQNVYLKEENRELQSVIERLEKDYEKFTEDAGKREEELTEYKMELINKTRKFSAEVEEKDAKINSLTLLNEALEHDKKKIETKSSERQQIAEIYMKLNELLSNVTEISEKTLQLHNQEQQEEKKSLESKVLELQKQVQTLEGNKEWELVGIDGTLKETFLTIMELLAQQLLNNQEQSVKEQKLEELTLSYNNQVHQIEELQLENDSLEEQNRELRSRNRKLESEVARLKEESIQSKVEFASGMVKAFKDSEKKCMKTGSLTLLNEELGASVEKLSDQLSEVKSIERQQPQSTQGSQQQLEGETIKHSGISTTIGGRNN